MIRLLARSRVRVRVRGRAVGATLEQRRGVPSVLLGKYARLGSSMSSKPISMSASVSGRLDDDTKEAIVSMRSASSSSFSIIVDKARGGRDSVSGDGGDRQLQQEPPRVERKPSDYKKRSPPRIVLAGKDAVGDMEGDDIEQLLSTVGKGEVWRHPDQKAHASYEVIRPLGTGSFGRVLLVRAGEGGESGSEDSALYAMKMNLKSTSEINAEEAAKANEQLADLTAFVAQLPAGIVQGHMTDTALPALKERIAEASPPQTDLRLFDGNVVRRAHAEKIILQSMDFPFINKVKAVYEDDSSGRVFMLLDYVPGGTLKFHLAAAPEGRFDEQAACFYAAELVLALEYMSRPEVNVSHRDLKPENIMLDEHGHVVVMDFGLATRLRGALVKTFCGTAEYLAPEVLSEQSWEKDTLDWWSFAVILYEMLAGKTPFEGSSAKEVFLNILQFEMLLTFPQGFPEEAKSLVRLILKRDPHERPSVEEIKSHPFFAKHEIDWGALAERRSTPPHLASLELKLQQAAGSGYERGA